LFINEYLEPIENKEALRRMIAGHVSEYLKEGGTIGIYTAFDNADQLFMRPMNKAERADALKERTHQQRHKESL